MYNRLLSIADPNRRLTRFNYNEEGRPFEVNGEYAIAPCMCMPIRPKEDAIS